MAVKFENALHVIISIQGHIDLDHENNNCLIISETVQTIIIKFAVKIVQLKVYIICQSDDLDLQSRSQLYLKLDKFVTYS